MLAHAPDQLVAAIAETPLQRRTHIGDVREVQGALGAVRQVVPSATGLLEPLLIVGGVVRRGGGELVVVAHFECIGPRCFQQAITHRVAHQACCDH